MLPICGTVLSSEVKMNNENLIRNRSWTAITYPQDFCDNGAELGPQTILRLQTIVDTHRCGIAHVGNIVLACGIGPEVRRYPNQTRSFAVMMKEWLIAEGTFDQSIIHCSRDDKVWNCIDATVEMMKLIKSLNLSRNVLVVSTAFHIYPRMWITWRILCAKRKPWQLAFIPAWEGTYSIIHELGGTVKYIPMVLWYRLIRKV